MKMKKKMLLSLASLSLVSLMGAGSVHAQEYKEIKNEVNLNASGSSMVEQDYLTLRLAITVEGENAKQVQEVLSQNLNKALQVAKAKEVRDGNRLLVKSDNINVYPLNRKQQIVSWQGRGTITLEGQDIGAIRNLAATLPNMVIENMNLSLSREKASALKEEVIKKAIDNFKDEAKYVTRVFGFNSYEIKNVSVNYSQGGSGPIRPYMMAARASESMVESTPIPVSTSELEVTASVNGTIIMK